MLPDERGRLLRIRTPEGIEFALPLAGPVTRALALSLDVACVIAISTGIGSVVRLLSLVSRDAASALSIAVYFVVSIGYGITTEWLWRGQTLGKRLLKLRVVDASGLRLTLPQVVVRNLLRPVDSLPAAYLVGGLASFLSSRAQRLGDLAANTVVIRAARRTEPDLGQLMRGAHNSFDTVPHLCARLRQHATAELASIALTALLRRDQLEPSARIALFARIAAELRALVPFPEQATEGLSDEQYVRNAADVLFRAAKT